MKKKYLLRTVYYAIEWLLPILTWLLYTNISLKQFASNNNLRLSFLLGVCLLIILNISLSKNINLLWLTVANLGYLGITYFLQPTLTPIVSVMLVADLLVADLLTRKTTVNDPYSRWVCFSLINGTGIVLIARMFVNSYLTNAELLMIVMLIFANLLFSYPRFVVKQMNPLFIAGICCLILMTGIMMGLPFEHLLTGALIVGLYILVESRINPKLWFRKWYVAIIANLIFSLALIL